MCSDVHEINILDNVIFCSLFSIYGLCDFNNHTVLWHPDIFLGFTQFTWLENTEIDINMERKKKSYLRGRNYKLKK